MYCKKYIEILLQYLLGKKVLQLFRYWPAIAILFVSITNIPDVGPSEGQFGVTHWAPLHAAAAAVVAAPGSGSDGSLLALMACV